MGVLRWCRPQPQSLGHVRGVVFLHECRHPEPLHHPTAIATCKQTSSLLLFRIKLVQNHRSDSGRVKAPAPHQWCLENELTPPPKPSRCERSQGQNPIDALAHNGEVCAANVTIFGVHDSHVGVETPTQRPRPKRAASRAHVWFLVTTELRRVTF